MSKQAKLLSHLQTGSELTAKQITGSFGIAHPGSAIRSLRAQGNCVYTNTNQAGTVKYRIGAPTKRMVALANAVAGAGLFTR